MTRLLPLAVAALALAGCAAGAQRSQTTRSLDSGVTASSGGGQSVLHNQPNVGLSPGGQATVSGIRNSPTTPCATNRSLAGC